VTTPTLISQSIFTVLPDAITLTSVTFDDANQAFLFTLDRNAGIFSTFQAGFPAAITFSGQGFDGGMKASVAANHLGCYLAKVVDPLSAVSYIVTDFVSDTSLTSLSPFFNVSGLIENYFDGLPTSSLPKHCTRFPPDGTKKPEKHDAHYPYKTVTDCMIFYCSHPKHLTKAICTPSLPFQVSVTNDCGYSWSQSVALDFPFKYQTQSAASGTVVALSLLFFSALALLLF